MNPLLIAEEEVFKAGKDKLLYSPGRLDKITNGSLIYCVSGEAEVMINLKQYQVIPHTCMVLFPGSIFSVSSASEDFLVLYFSFSKEMVKKIFFRLEPSFIHFLKETACFTSVHPDSIKVTLWVLETGLAIYDEKENVFRDRIAQHLLQIFFLNAFDKAQRLFTKAQLEGADRKSQLFKKFIRLVHTHCVEQRDVSFYAEKLCISSRYLSEVTRSVTKHSTKKLIDEFLVLEIKVLLQTTNLSLKEIAERCRFPDQSFFGRYFKKHTGMSPKEFREKM
ncbi:AraC family transcriptional regulator [Bacteroides sp. 224]|uniref:helix-turn-helix domain-containing protein n=1 Tax=Bacteroides sp. 224 TaxID=2302936 RepID=UPI0013D70190|nr:helix-turn-helix domain-containing protein [Bacteroides sp. 224]NDV65354.1 AraC family transcriptional regulator [Bacteroides sp. 224]